MKICIICNNIALDERECPETWVINDYFIKYYCHECGYRVDVDRNDNTRVVYYRFTIKYFSIEAYADDEPQTHVNNRNVEVYIPISHNPTFQELEAVYLRLLRLNNFQ